MKCCKTCKHAVVPRIKLGNEMYAYCNVPLPEWLPRNRGHFASAECWDNRVTERDGRVCDRWEPRE